MMPSALQSASNYQRREDGGWGFVLLRLCASVGAGAAVHFNACVLFISECLYVGEVAKGYVSLNMDIYSDDNGKQFRILAVFFLQKLLPIEASMLLKNLATTS